jgi:hypothetical protein
MLAGAFFCRRDDPELSDPRNILPTLIRKLAIIFPPFRSTIAECLRKDPNVTSEPIKHTLFLSFIRALPRHPKKSLVFVIDALDECGSAQNVQDTLQALTSAAYTLRGSKSLSPVDPKIDIQDALTSSLHLRYDLAEDKEATSDLRIFAKDRFSKVAGKRRLQSWPEQSLFDGVISRAAGLFTFTDTLLLTLRSARMTPLSV